MTTSYTNGLRAHTVRAYEKRIEIPQLSNNPSEEKRHHNTLCNQFSTDFYLMLICWRVWMCCRRLDTVWIYVECGMRNVYVLVSFEEALMERGECECEAHTQTQRERESICICGHVHVLNHGFSDEQLLHLEFNEIFRTLMQFCWRLWLLLLIPLFPVWSED